MGVFRHDKTAKDFDDGINAIPGDPEFTRDLAEAHFGDKAFSYISTPTYEPPLVAVFEKQLADAKEAQDVADAEAQARYDAALAAEQEKIAEVQAEADAAKAAELEAATDAAIAAEEVAP